MIRARSADAVRGAGRSAAYFTIALLSIAGGCGPGAALTDGGAIADGADTGLDASMAPSCPVVSDEFDRVTDVDVGGGSTWLLTRSGAILELRGASATMRAMDTSARLFSAGGDAITVWRGDGFGRWHLDGTPDGSLTSTSDGGGNGAFDMAVTAGAIFLLGGDVGRDVLIVNRFSSDGAHDDSFGIDGRAEIPADAGRGGHILVHPSGAIFVTGSVGYVPFIARFTSAGTLDTAFGADGVVELEGGAGDRDALIDAAGRIVILSRASSVALTRVEMDGMLDASFGIGGIADIPTPPGSVLPWDLFEHDGALYVASMIEQDSAAGETHSVGVIRVSDSGQLDTSFGEDGWNFVPAPATEDTSGRYYDRVELGASGTQLILSAEGPFVSQVACLAP